MSTELSSFKSFKQDTGRQIERLSSLAKTSEKAHNLAMVGAIIWLVSCDQFKAFPINALLLQVRALEAELAVANLKKEAKERDAKHATQIAALSRLPKALAAERAATMESMSQAASILRTSLASTLKHDASAEDTGGIGTRPVLLTPGAVAELFKHLQVGSEEVFVSPSIVNEVVRASSTCTDDIAESAEAGTCVPTTVSEGQPGPVAIDVLEMPETVEVTLGETPGSVAGGNLSDPKSVPIIKGDADSDSAT